MHRVAEENIHFCLADRKTSSIGDEEATGGFEVILRDYYSKCIAIQIQLIFFRADYFKENYRLCFPDCIPMALILSEWKSLWKIMVICNFVFQIE